MDAVEIPGWGRREEGPGYLLAAVVSKYYLGWKEDGEVLLTSFCMGT